MIITLKEYTLEEETAIRGWKIPVRGKLELRGLVRDPEAQTFIATLLITEISEKGFAWGGRPAYDAVYILRVLPMGTVGHCPDLSFSTCTFAHTTGWYGICYQDDRLR